MVGVGGDAPPEPNIFEQLDTSGDGILDMDEVREMGVQLGQDWSQEELEDLFHEKDTDNSGGISADEFLDWWLKRVEELAILEELAGLEASASAAPTELEAPAAPVDPANMTKAEKKAAKAAAAEAKKF